MRKQILKQHLNGVDFSLCNSLHRTRPLLPKHHDSIRRALSHPLENTRHAARKSDYESDLLFAGQVFSVGWNCPGRVSWLLFG
jgi:hypothetical protein